MPESGTDAADATDASAVGDPQRDVTLVERRYRGWLRLLPEDYRRQWEDDMVDTFLAGTLAGDEEQREIAGYGKPPLAEVTSLVALAVRLRLGTKERAPRPLLWRAAWRRVALVGLLVNAIWATVSLPPTLWLAGWLPGVPAPVDTSQQAVSEGNISLEVVAGWWHSYWTLAGLASVAAFVLLLLGRRRTAALLAVAGVLPGLVQELRFAIYDGPAFTSALITDVGLRVLPVLALLAYVGAPAPARRRPWLLAWLAGVVLLLALSILAWSATLDVLMDPTGFYCLALPLAGAAYLVVMSRHHQSPDPGWVLTLAILSVVVLLDRLATLSTFWFVDGNDDAVSERLMYSGVVQAVLVGGAVVAFGALATRAVRQLPAVVDR